VSQDANDKAETIGVMWGNALSGSFLRLAAGRPEERSVLTKDALLEKGSLRHSLFLGTFGVGRACADGWAGQGLERKSGQKCLLEKGRSSNCFHMSHERAAFMGRAEHKPS